MRSGLVETVGGLGRALPPVVLLLLVPGTLPAQDYRGSLDVNSRLIEVRPILQDTVPRSEVTETDDGRFLFDGRQVECPLEDRCTFFRSGEVESAVALTQDLRLTGWGFGIRGLSATVHARSRQDAGSDDFVWPRSDDAVDLLVGYVQLAREEYRIRGGRQRTRTGLGFSSYDGLSVRLVPLEWLSVEAFGGRSLARGLSQPRNEILQGVGSFFPDRNAYLLGATARTTPGDRTTLVARYQREIWSDRSALVSERASLDGRTGLLAPVYVTGSMDWDFAAQRVGKATLSARLPLQDGAFQVELRGRRYVPYFELWTIWGLFNPVAYHEGELRGTWSPLPGLGIRIGGGYRQYDDAGTAPVRIGPTEDDAWFVEAGGRWQPDELWRLSARYRAERGVGAFVSLGELGARWQGMERLSFSLHATASQQVEEFRFGEAMVAGGSAATRIGVTDRLTLDGSLGIYHQFFEDRASDTDWSQLRGSLGFRLELGRDPGLERRSGR